MTFPDDDVPDPMTADLLGRAPRSIAPGRDLWPEIEGRLRRRGRWTARRIALIIAPTLAVAAALVLMFGHPGPRARGADAESAEFESTLTATTGPRSATAHSLARHLTILDGAIAETEAALRETPRDPALTEFLQTLQRRRLTLLAQAARFAAES